MTNEEFFDWYHKIVYARMGRHHPIWEHVYEKYDIDWTNPLISIFQYKGSKDILENAFLEAIKK